jgi:hypothetical protein
MFQMLALVMLSPGLASVPVNADVQNTVVKYEVVLSAIEGLVGSNFSDVTNAQLFDLWLTPLMLHAPRSTTIWARYYSGAATELRDSTSVEFWASLLCCPYYTTFKLATKLRGAEQGFCCVMLYIWSLCGMIIHPMVYMYAFSKQIRGQVFVSCHRIALGEIVVESVITALCLFHYYAAWSFLAPAILATWSASRLLPPFSAISLGFTVELSKSRANVPGTFVLSRLVAFEITKMIGFGARFISHYVLGLVCGVAFWGVGAWMLVGSGQTASSFLLEFNLFASLVAPLVVVVRRVMLPSVDEMVAAIADDKARGAVARAISDMRAGATRIVLRGARVGDDGVKALAMALPASTVTYLHLEGASIGDEGAKSISMALPRGNVTSLSLPGNNIGDEGAIALASSLLVGNLGDDHDPTAAGHMYNAVIRTAFMNAERLGRPSHAIIRHGHGHAPNFWASLNLEGNVIGDDGANALAAVLPYQRTASSVKLSGNNISEALQQVLRDSSAANIHF